jgi:hypothetical protein
MKAITGFHPYAPPSTAFTVFVAQLNSPGHPTEEYTIERHYVGDVKDYRHDNVLLQDGVEITRHRNLGALLNTLLED